MREISSATVIAAPDAAVWELLCDQGRYPEWGVNTLAVSPPDARVALGAVRQERNRLAGPVRTRARWVVTECDPPRAQAHRAERGMPLVHDITVRLELEPSDGSTVLTLRWVYSPTALGRLLEPMFRGALRRDQLRSLERLRAICEREAR